MDFKLPAVDNLLFAGLAIPELDRELVLREISLFPESAWFWDEFRATWMLPMMTRDGGGTRISARRLPERIQGDENFRWTPYAPNSLVQYFEEQIFTWVRPRPRIVILKTLPGAKNNEHSDCTKILFGTRQHKLRIVLSGKTSSLFFKTKNGRVYAPEVTTPFVMDGSWPHGMENNSTLPKITICTGAPWTGTNSYPHFNALVTKDGLDLPENYADYFEA